MHQLKLEDAQPRLAELITEVANGEEVLITRRDGRAFRIVPAETRRPTPKFGSARELIKMADNFDEPLEDFEAYGP